MGEASRHHRVGVVPQTSGDAGGDGIDAPLQGGEAGVRTDSLSKFIEQAPLKMPGLDEATLGMNRKGQKRK